MADFIQKTNVKTATRTLAAPITVSHLPLPSHRRLAFFNPCGKNYY